MLWKLSFEFVFLCFNTVLALRTPQNEVCETRDCIKAANRLLSNMDETVDPCEDFHLFSCGKFLRETPIPDDRGQWTLTFDAIAEDIFRDARLLLDDEQDYEHYYLDIMKEDKEAAYNVDKKVKKFYKSCNNQAYLEELGVQPLLRRLKSIGGWPVLEGDDWNEGIFNWWETIFKMNKIGFDVNMLITLQTNADAKNVSYRVIELDQPKLGIEREFLLEGFDHEDVQSYLRYMIETAQLLAPDRDSEAIEDEMEDTLRFEIWLAEISSPKEFRRNESELYNPVILDDMKSKSNHPPSWKDYVETLINDGQQKKFSFGPKDKIILVDPSFIESFSVMINETSPRVIANYLGWRASMASMGLLNEAAREIKQRFDKAIEGQNEALPIWKSCLQAVGFNSMETENFAFAASSMYIRKHFKPEAKEDIESLVEMIREAFGTILSEEVDWMDKHTKEKAMLKLLKMRQLVAYPNELLNRRKLDLLFDTINISELDYMGNTMQLKKFWRGFQFSRIRQKIDPESWHDYPMMAMVNAFYDPNKNLMLFPAGVLQDPFYNPRVPKYLNFGGIGVVIGHEITHGFDDQGRQRNAHGELENWWQPDTEERFYEIIQCIIDQYDNYTVKQVDMNVDGLNTEGENTGDNGGVKQAYLAYNSWSKENPDEPGLPGLPYTNRQLFWLSYGQLGCMKYHDAALRKMILTGYHSPGEFRTNGPVSNSYEFSADFNCPIGSRMNPVRKCGVWRRTNVTE